MMPLLTMVIVDVHKEAKKAERQEFIFFSFSFVPFLTNREQ